MARGTELLASAASGALGALAACPACLAAAAGPAGVCEPCRAWLADAVAASPAPLGATCWLGPYAGPWERLVTAFKHAGARRLARLLGGLLALRTGAWGFAPDLVTAVPASPRRLAERGFDQAALLAAEVAGVRGLPYRPALARSPASRSQQRLSRASRAVNAGGAFGATGPVRGRVLLVDDVLTTGATARSCAAALASAGAAEVRVAVVARAVRGAPAPRGPW